jgi:chemotaxis receptor (MCP) glutamine deamidase CheD
VTGDLRALRALGELLERERRGGRALATVRPGDWLVACEPTNIAATVDSSLLVCLWDVDERMGGVCHFSEPTGEPIVALLDELEGAGCDRRRLRAKLFGGCDAATDRDVGARNVAVAEQLLETLDIPIIARDTGGARPRKVTLHTDDFSAWIWRMG